MKTHRYDIKKEKEIRYELVNNKCKTKKERTERKRKKRANK